ncbi:TPA: hypothetical protein DCW54_00995 [Candidatus Dependentiae bacterium]|nr:hypothetical protein [Candidatus Dependentiae bacterium]
MKTAAIKRNGARQFSVSMNFQLVMMTLSLVLIAIIFSQALMRVPIDSPKSGIKEITPMQKQFAGGDPVNLSVGLSVRDFPLFNMRAGTFIVDVSVFFVFDPRLITVERISDFAFHNSEVVSKSEPFVKLVGTTIFLRYDVRLKFDFDLYYQRFPFEGHRLSFILTHPNLTPEEVVYSSTRQDFVINPSIVIPGWRTIDRQVNTGYEERVVSLTPDEREFSFYSPSAVFSMVFERVGVRQSFTIFIPLLLLFLIALVTFSFGARKGLETSGIGLSAAVITALIGYRFVIESMSPKVSYLLISDYIYLVFLAVACLVFLVNIFSDYLSLMAKKIILVLLHMVVVGSIWYYFLFF